MDCSRIEELIPLYVEGDLAPEHQSSMSSHLKGCGRCAGLAREYTESQRWLRSAAPPEFDEAFFGGLRASVLAEIESRGARPSWLQLLAARWSLRPAFAAAAVLVLLGLVAFYLLTGRGRDARDQYPPDKLIQVPPGSGPESPATGEPKDRVERAGVEEERSSGDAMAPGKQATPPKRDRAVARHKLFAGRRSVAKRPAPVPARVVEDEGGLATLNGVIGAAAVRIEIQTSDPNVRIIWFATKESETQSPRP
jgi:hypothetical protein